MSHSTIQPEESQPIKLTYTTEDDPKLKKLLMSTIEYLTGRKKLEKLYRDIDSMGLQAGPLWNEIIRRLDINIVYDEKQLEKVQDVSPLVFIANHPFGVVDGLIMGSLAAKVREGFFILANEALCKDRLLNQHMLPIDFRETKQALQTNIETRRKTMEKLEAGDILIIFPAGGVSTAPKPFGKAEDLEWKRFVVKLIQKTKATVLPVFVHGQNSRLFQIASHINPNLRLSLLLNEVRNKVGQDVHLSIGDPIPFEGIAHFKDRQKLLDHLREITYAQGAEQAPVKKKKKIKLRLPKRFSKKGED
jgi:putative hemolysin